MRNHYGDLFHKPLSIKKQEKEVIRMIVKEIKDYYEKHYERLKKNPTRLNTAYTFNTVKAVNTLQSLTSTLTFSSTNENHKEEDCQIKIKRYSFALPFLYYRTSFIFLNTISSKYKILLLEMVNNSFDKKFTN